MANATPLLVFLGIILILGTILGSIASFIGYTPTLNENETYVDNTINTINESRSITIPIFNIELTLIPEWISNYFINLISGFAMIPTIILVPLLVFLGSGIIYSVIVLIRG